MEPEQSPACFKFKFSSPQATPAKPSAPDFGSTVFKPASFKFPASFASNNWKPSGSLFKIDTQAPRLGSSPFGLIDSLAPETPDTVDTAASSHPTSASSTSPVSIEDAHKSLLSDGVDVNDAADEILAAPIFSEPVRGYALSLAKSNNGAAFSQYGLLAGNINGVSLNGNADWTLESDPRIFYNIAAPSSVFICGSQGSGKSHSLSCLLENCLVPSDANTLPRPLTGLVFHYDSFISENAGSPCEAAYLSSAKGVKVRVLCSPTNTGQIKRIYSKLPNVEIEELRINESDLNTRRMLDLMAVNSGSHSLPLYLSVINRILRELRIEQQQTKTSFNYGKFKRMIDSAALTDAQLAPLQQRLETLESFMVQNQAMAYDLFNRGNMGPQLTKAQRNAQRSNEWTAKPGQLTIVDLSCPCITAEMACSLFGICLSLFLEQGTYVGRVVALDEAHKFMTNSAECQSLTESLLSTIRLQRHLGARVIISTQEPTISPRLLDLCSITIVHRFTSPDWLATLKQHLAGASSCVDVIKGIDCSDEVKDLVQLKSEDEATNENGDREHFETTSPAGSSKYLGIRPLSVQTPHVASGLFEKIVSLRTGEALMFAPNAIIGIKEQAPVRLGPGVLKVRIRKRVTLDGGRSILAA